MTRLILVLLLVGVVTLGGSAVASPDSTPPTVSQLKAKIRSQANRIAILNDQVDAQDALIADQIDTITRLRARDPLDAIIARGPDGQWDAILAIWRAFPTLPDGQLCGYDKSSIPGDGLGLTLTSWTFYKWAGC